MAMADDVPTAHRLPWSRRTGTRSACFASLILIAAVLVSVGPRPSLALEPWQRMEREPGRRRTNRRRCSLGLGRVVMVLRGPLGWSAHLGGLQ